MNFSPQEEVMYRVMEAIYNSNIPINFKGSMVLKAFLVESGYVKDTRHTVDIDANWNSDEPPSTEAIARALQNAISSYSDNYKVFVIRQYAQGRSAGFAVKDKSSNEELFTMDIDVNKPLPETKLYEISGIKFSGFSPAQMVADKICVISKDKIFRRIKDLVDLFLLTQVSDLDKNQVLNIIAKGTEQLGDFDAFLNRTQELEHSYSKFRFDGSVSKPNFNEVYTSVKEYISKFII